MRYRKYTANAAKNVRSSVLAVSAANITSMYLGFFKKRSKLRLFLLTFRDSVSDDDTLYTTLLYVVRRRWSSTRRTLGHVSPEEEISKR